MSITVNKDIVNVDLTVESTSLTQDAFSTICFITQGDSKLPDNVFVNKLDDLLNAGYLRDSKAYNFCYGVFLQGKLNNILVRRCLSSESYLDCYKKYNNNSFYYLVLESKLVYDIFSVGNYLDSIKALKTLFFSSSEDFSKDLKGLESVVYYYLDSLDKSIDDSDYLLFDDGSTVLIDDGSTVLIDENQPISVVPPRTNISCAGATNYYQGRLFNIGAVYGKHLSSVLEVFLVDVKGNTIERLFEADYVGLQFSDPKVMYSNVQIDSSIDTYNVQKLNHGVDLVRTEWSWGDDYQIFSYFINTSTENKRLRIKVTHTDPSYQSGSENFVDKNQDFFICLAPMANDENQPISVVDDQTPLISCTINNSQSKYENKDLYTDGAGRASSKEATLTVTNLETKEVISIDIRSLKYFDSFTPTNISLGDLVISVFCVNAGDELYYSFSCTYNGAGYAPVHFYMPIDYGDSSGNQFYKTLDDTVCLKKAKKATFFDENQIACPRSTGDGGMYKASYKTDFSKDSGFYIKIYGNKYNNFNGLEDTSTIFEKSIDGGSIRDLLLDSSYQEFLWKYPLDISIENSDNDLSLVTLSLGENTEYLEHVFQINIAQNPPMYLDFDASWQKLSADGKNISFCFHRHGS